MRMRITLAGLLLSLALAVAGCGHDGSGDGSGDKGGLPNCGNGTIDGGEQCDDGNLVDEDACLATCQHNVCGDGFIAAGIEECDIFAPVCSQLGFTGGTSACTNDCRIDTSGCTGQGGVPTPTPRPTAAGGVPTATSTDGGGATPVPTPTPSGGGNACAPGDPVAVTVAIDVAYGAARIDLEYPADAINVPGSGTAPSVVDRVAFSADGGLTTVNDDDNIATLTTSLVTFAEQPAGPFATVTFDCVTEIPEPSAFTCTVVSASTPGGVAIPAACSVSVL